MNVLYPVQRARIDRVGLLNDFSLSNILQAGAGLNSSRCVRGATCAKLPSSRIWTFWRNKDGACGLMACTPKRVHSTFRRARDRNAALQRMWDLLLQAQLRAANEPSLCMWLPSFISLIWWKVYTATIYCWSPCSFGEGSRGVPFLTNTVLYPCRMLAKRAAIAVG